MARPRHRWLKILAIAVVAILVATLATCLMVGRIFRNHLAEAIDKGMGAKLETSAVLYRPPFGLILYHPRITLPAPAGGPVEIFGADRVVLRLVKLPHEHEPLLIRSLSLRKPVAHVVRTQEGWLFRTTTAAANSAKSDAKELKASPNKKHRASDAFRLDDFSMSDARLVYDDRTQGEPSEQTVLSGLSAAIHPAGASKSAYACRLWGVGPTQLKTSVAIDIDDRTADVEELRWEFDLGKATQLSISQNKVASASGQIDGNLRLEARGHLGAGDRSHDVFEGTLELKNGKANLPAWKLDLDQAAFQVHVQAKTPDNNSSAGKTLASLTIQSASALSAGLTMKLAGGVFSIGNDRRWKLDDLLGFIDAGADNTAKNKAAEPANGSLAAFLKRTDAHGHVDFTAAASGPLKAPRSENDFKDFHWQMIAFPRGVAIRSPKFALPFEHVGGGGTITLRDGVVELKNLTGNYGPDQYLLDNARLLLFDPAQDLHLVKLKERVRFQEINGAMIFKQPGPAYPGGFGKVVSQLRPAGTFFVGGSQYTFHPRRSGAPRLPWDYDFHVSTSGGIFNLSARPIPLTDIHGQATITPAEIAITQFGADVLGGNIVIKGKIAPKKPTTYDGKISITDIDLAKLASQLKLPEPKHGKINGDGYANITIASAPIGSSTQSNATALQRLTADGEVEILQADFYPIPVLEDVVPVVRRNEAKTVGDAAGVFNVANETITLKDFAVNSPAMGLQGSGTIGFDKSLDLQAVATPLGDWGDKLKQSHIPIISEVAGDIVGAVQKLVNAAQSTLLYKIHVTGTTDHPDVQTVPAPAITDSVALLFGKMLQPDGKPHGLLEAVREQGKK